MAKHGLFVGINSYENRDDIVPLQYAAQDATAVQNFFVRCGYEPTLLLNTDATAKAINRHLKRIARALRPGDLFVFYFSGHGYRLGVRGEERHYLLPYEADLWALQEGNPGAAIPVAFLQECTSRPGVSRAIVLDACRGPLSAHKGVGDEAATYSSRNIAAVVTDAPHEAPVVLACSCHPGQKAYEASQIEGGLFTVAMLSVFDELRGRGEPIVLPGDTSQAIAARVRQMAAEAHIPPQRVQEPWIQGSAAGVVIVPGSDELEARRRAAEELRLRPHAQAERQPPPAPMPRLVPPAPVPTRAPAPSPLPPKRSRALPWTLAAAAVALLTLMALGIALKGPDRVQVAKVPLEGDKVAVDLGQGVSLELVRIPAGSFLMGSEKGESEEKPVHRVTFAKPFYMGKYEVTQPQWEAIMGSNPSAFKNPDRSVEMVSWDDCQEFLRKVTERTGHKFALPSEAQWEYACRAGSTTEYCFGDDESGLGEYGWHSGNSSNSAHPVGQKKPNAWGLYDMHGNVWEWCEDAWHASYDGAPQDGSAWQGDVTVRVVRGGCWLSLAGLCRSAFRGRTAPEYRRYFSGVRLVVDLD